MPNNIDSPAPPNQADIARARRWGIAAMTLPAIGGVLSFPALYDVYRVEPTAWHAVGVAMIIAMTIATYALLGLDWRHSDWRRLAAQGIERFTRLCESVGGSGIQGGR